MSSGRKERYCLSKCLIEFLFLLVNFKKKLWMKEKVFFKNHRKGFKSSNEFFSHISISLSRYYSYVKAAANTRLVGKQLAFLLKGLEKNNGLNYTLVHVIGFSLGNSFVATDFSKM